MLCLCVTNMFLKSVIEVRLSEPHTRKSSYAPVFLIFDGMYVLLPGLCG